MSSKFSYQGVLRENGKLVTGSRDMVFHLFSDSACTLPISGDISRPGVSVKEGLFSVELAVHQNYIDGQGLWLEIRIGGTVVGCQEILPVPYALSLRPGASVTGQQTSWDAIHAVNTAPTGSSYGVYARSYSTGGRGLSAWASAASGTTYGVYAQSDSASGAGVYARGRDAGIDVLLGGNANTTAGDDGVLSSDPTYASSDLVFLTNDGIRIELDNDGDGEDADIEVRDKDGVLIFNIDESGAVSFGGTGLVAYPRPAYDSGWLTFSLGEVRALTHNLGGNADKYVVDLTCKRISGGAGVNNWSVGGDANGTSSYGSWWSNLTTSNITLHRWNNETDCPDLRVRIWMYP